MACRIALRLGIMVPMTRRRALTLLTVQGLAIVGMIVAFVFAPLRWLGAALGPSIVLNMLAVHVLRPRHRWVGHMSEREWVAVTADVLDVPVRALWWPYIGLLALPVIVLVIRLAWLLR